MGIHVIILISQAVCQKLGLDTGDRLATNSKKRKWLVKDVPDKHLFPPYQDFEVSHNYLQTYTKNMQARLRKRGQKGLFNNIYSYGRTNYNFIINRSLELYTYNTKAKSPWSSD